MLRPTNLKNRGGRDHYSVTGLRELILGSPTDEYPIACRRCRRLLTDGKWKAIGADTITGQQVWVCAGCFDELKE